MKKFFYAMMSLAMLGMLVACEPKNKPDTPDEEDDAPEYMDKSKKSEMVVYVGPIAVAADTTIIVTDVEESLSGAKQMGISGTIKGVKGFRVTATRSEAGQKDELCAGVQCVPGDGELKQVYEFNLLNGSTEATWYTHYTPTKSGDYTVDYKFENYNRTLTIKVIYRYAE